MGMRKVRLCNKLGDPGGCPYGDRCTFAHGALPSPVAHFHSTHRRSLTRGRARSAPNLRRLGAAACVTADCFSPT
jgi:hypothetical protein